jgi:hypothetical protein
MKVFIFVLFAICSLGEVVFAGDYEATCAGNGFFVTFEVVNGELVYYCLCYPQYSINGRCIVCPPGEGYLAINNMCYSVVTDTQCTDAGGASPINNCPTNSGCRYIASSDECLASLPQSPVSIANAVTDPTICPEGGYTIYGGLICDNGKKNAEQIKYNVNTTKIDMGTGQSKYAVKLNKILMH